MAKRNLRIGRACDPSRTVRASVGSYRPVDCQRRIIPDQPALVFVGIIVIDLIDDFGVRFERAKSVREAPRNEHLFAALGRQPFRDPHSIGWCSHTQVDRHVKDAPAQYPNDLGLRERRKLEMQASDGAALCRERLIVLHERRCYSRFAKSALIESLNEVAPIIEVSLASR